jgi:hypothetical protein
VWDERDVFLAVWARDEGDIFFSTVQARDNRDIALQKIEFFYLYLYQSTCVAARPPARRISSAQTARRASLAAEAAQTPPNRRAGY